MVKYHDTTCVTSNGLLPGGICTWHLIFCTFSQHTTFHSCLETIQLKGHVTQAYPLVNKLALAATVVLFQRKIHTRKVKRSMRDLLIIKSLDYRPTSSKL